MPRKILILFTAFVCLIQVVPLSTAEERLMLRHIVKDRYYQKIIHRYYQYGTINEKGVAGKNVTTPGEVDVWNQKICWHAIVRGIGVRHERDIVFGIKAIQHTFEKMADNGSFKNASTGSVIRFLLAFSKSYYEIKYSEYNSRYTHKLDVHIPKLKKAIYHILNSRQWEKEQVKILNYSNQSLGIGLTLKLIGNIVGDKKLMDYGNSLFYKGLQKQTGKGIFPEKRAYDASYQAISLQFIELYYLYLADLSEKKILFPIMKKGWEWELTQIDASGNIKTSGYTKTKLKQALWHGKGKDIDYTDVTLSLIYWSYISHDKKARKLAKKIYNHNLAFSK